MGVVAFGMWKRWGHWKQSMCLEALRSLEPLTNVGIIAFGQLGASGVLKGIGSGRSLLLRGAEQIGSAGGAGGAGGRAGEGAASCRTYWQRSGRDWLALRFRSTRARNTHASEALGALEGGWGSGRSYQESAYMSLPHRRAGRVGSRRSSSRSLSTRATIASAPPTGTECREQRGAGGRGDL